MSANHKSLPKIPVPKSWPRHVRSAVLEVISLAQFAAAYTRGWAANSINARVRLSAEVDRFREEVGGLREELRVKDGRMGRIDPKRRPYYSPTERMVILQLKAARGWSLRQTAKRFLVTAGTIASWEKRLDEQGPQALVQVAEPVNKFPDFVRYMVRRLKCLCPAMGKKKMAEMLCRAGLHLGTTTVGRILKEESTSTPKPTWDKASASSTSGRVVTAKRPNHVWHVDLTAVPVLGGFWASWLPGALPQCWPFCWWVAVVIDHYSRRAMGYRIFRAQPSSKAMQAFLDRTIGKNGAKPKYTITDKGGQFCCPQFKRWCRSRGVKPRFGAVGKHGSIAVIERFIQTVKNECTRVIMIPFRRRSFREELARFVEWYNQWRPHMTLDGRTPDEVYHKQHPACRYPRFEPRSRWPRRAACAQPGSPIRGKPGVALELHVDLHGGRKHLPVITLKRAA